jgi:hypothetical protein
MKIIPMVWFPMKVGDNKRSTIQMESFERKEGNEYKKEE